MIETPSVSIWRKTELGLALPSSHDRVLYTLTPLTNNLSPILHKRDRAIINSIHMTFSLVGLNRVKLVFDKIQPIKGRR